MAAKGETQAPDWLGSALPFAAIFVWNADFLVVDEA